MFLLYNPGQTLSPLQIYIYKNPISPIKTSRWSKYTGYWRNVWRGRRKKHGTCESDFIIDNCEHNKGANKSWVRLIKKIYEVNPLICPKCDRQDEDNCLPDVSYSTGLKSGTDKDLIYFDSIFERKYSK